MIFSLSPFFFLISWNFCLLIWASTLRGLSSVILTVWTGVPKLKRSELESACENFSNVIGSSSVCTLYKGTLSSGVEIAVISRTVASTKDWSKDMEAQFRKKVFQFFQLEFYISFSPNYWVYKCFSPAFTRLIHCQRSITRTLWAFLVIVKKRIHLPEWWFLNMLLMGPSLNICTVSFCYQGVSVVIYLILLPNSSTSAWLNCVGNTFI